MTVINYTPNYQTIKATASMQQTDMNHPLFIPEYYIKPVTYLEYTQKDNEKHSFYKCPAWKSYWANTFVIFNQLDISFKWEKETGRVYDTSFPQNNAADFVYIQEGKIGNYDSSINKHAPFSYKQFLVIQWAQSMMFWPKKPNKNLWVEMVPYPDLHHKTGLELITAEFPLGRWYRSINGAYRCHKQTVDIPRGTPLYCVRFRGSKDNSYSLERWEDLVPPPEVTRKFRNNQGLKTWLPKKSWGMIKDDVEESKCPVSFLWRK